MESPILGWDENRCTYKLKVILRVYFTSFMKAIWRNWREVGPIHKTILQRRAVFKLRGKNLRHSLQILSPNFIYYSYFSFNRITLYNVWNIHNLKSFDKKWKKNSVHVRKLPRLRQPEKVDVNNIVAFHDLFLYSVACISLKGDINNT